ncbi:hypothetical protein HMPREF1316_1557 [Olsenella profusa F0195]|uniref:Uncharacterized protein n=1 Tax=Olsenella profusa F0195 TaxID=1125712 RepID=U2TUV0_9ACTN|nr:hypothetical protein HMPREF1316_1557 [Olsenella profusa F0195]
MRGTTMGRMPVMGIIGVVSPSSGHAIDASDIMMFQYY